MYKQAVLTHLIESLKESSVQTAEMAQWLRILAALEDPGSILSMVAPNIM